MFARHFIDSLDFARNGRELRGVVPLTEMPRLQDILSDPEGEISYFVRGLPDKNGKPMLEVTVDGLCQLRCQRCLNGFAYPVHLISRLLLARAYELDEFSVEEDDEVDSITAEKRLDVLNMIEEEILLSLPFAPKHPLGECKSVVEEINKPDAHPFAILKGLKGLSGLKSN
ncbi:MAG: YceD family protein [Nitrosomonadales bacterium]